MQGVCTSTAIHRELSKRRYLHVAENKEQDKDSIFSLFILINLIQRESLESEL